MEKIKEHNPFKAMESSTDVPENLKSKVMASINFSTMLMDIGELFTVKIGETFEKLFKIDPPVGETKETDID